MKKRNKIKQKFTDKKQTKWKYESEAGLLKAAKSFGNVLFKLRSINMRKYCICKGANREIYSLKNKLYE